MRKVFAVICSIAIVLAGAAILKNAASAEEDYINKAAAEIKPADKLITQKDEIVIEYRGQKNKVKLAKVGKNSIVLELRLPNGERPQLLRRAIRIPKFKDIDDSFWAKKQIELCVAANIIEKQKSIYFKPDGSVAREKFAKMLANAYGVKPPAASPTFAKDIPADDKSAKYIFYIVKTRKIMDLDSKGNFRPLDNITRAEAIVAFSKMEGLTENWDMVESPFEDLPARHRFARWISTAKAKGLLKFAEDRGYLDPDGTLTEAEFAWMISKTAVGNRAITNLLNWDIGFSTGGEKVKPIVINVIK